MPKSKNAAYSYSDKFPPCPLAPFISTHSITLTSGTITKNRAFNIAFLVITTHPPVKMFDVPPGRRAVDTV
jgi:hypothetical protein